MSGNEIALAHKPQIQGRGPITAMAITSDLEQQARQMDLAYTIAKSICKTTLCPKTFRDKPEDGAVAIMAGAKWGLDAITSLQQIFVVHGTPSTYARVMKAITLAHGHKIWVLESSPEKVVLAGHRANDPDHIDEVEWTLDRAKRAGYFSNSKYETEPENMLYARATAEMCRRLAPDALLGMPYSVEEMRDQEIVQARSERADKAEGNDRLGDALGDSPAPASAAAAAEEKAETAGPIKVDIDALIDKIAKVPDEKVLQEVWIEYRNLLTEAEYDLVKAMVTAKLDSLRNPPEDTTQPLDAETTDIKEEGAAA